MQALIKNLFTLFKIISSKNPISLSQFLKIYSIYKFSGYKTASLLTTTILCDKALIGKFGPVNPLLSQDDSIGKVEIKTTSSSLIDYFSISKLREVVSSKFSYSKNYLSLTLFWGLITYQANSKLKNVDSKYKVVLQTFYVITCIGLIIKSKDIFASNNDQQRITDSIIQISKFFDEEKIIDTLEEKFEESSYEGMKYFVLNSKTILLNKFILYTFGEQAINLIKVLFLERILTTFPMDKITMLSTVKNANGYEVIIKHLIIKSIRQIIELLNTKLVQHLDNSLKKEIDAKLAIISFDDSKTAIIIELGDNIKLLPTNITTTHQQAKTELAKIIENIFLTFLSNKNNEGVDTETEVFSHYSSLLLFEGFINTLLSNDNILAIQKYFQNKSSINENEFTEVISQKMGNCTLISTITPTTYGYQNIQEIAKLGGNQFILTTILNFIKSDHSSSFVNYNQSISFILLNAIKGMIETFIFILQAQFLDIKESEIFAIDSQVSQLSTKLKISEKSFQSYAGDINESINNLKFAINQLSHPITTGINRLMSKNLTLEIKNYSLKKVNDSKKMLEIDSCIFEAGKVYVIVGPIGSGKTTFLTDIAGCLANGFESVGSIYYPTINDQKIKQIFCGTTMFSPPKTSFFEKMTYRLESEFIEENKNKLEEDILTLFNDFKQTQFTAENIHLKSSIEQVQLSTGQQKVFIIISAILYKLYLNQPVLFVIDETLANLDTETTELVSTKIQEVFNDSIIIAVDHQYKNNGLYQTAFEMSDYQPITSLTIEKCEDNTAFSATEPKDEDTISLTGSLDTDPDIMD